MTTSLILKSVIYCFTVNNFFFNRNKNRGNTYPSAKERNLISVLDVKQILMIRKRKKSAIFTTKSVDQLSSSLSRNSKSANQALNPRRDGYAR